MGPVAAIFCSKEETRLFYSECFSTIKPGSWGSIASCIFLPVTSVRFDILREFMYIFKRKAISVDGATQVYTNSGILKQ